MAAVEVGVREGRRRERDVAEVNEATVLETSPTVKRRKLEEDVDVESRIIFSSPCVQATNRGGILARNSAGASETSVVIVRRREEQCQIPISEEDLDRASVSCCSSNRFEEKSKRRIEFVDFEEDETGTSWIHDNFNKSEQMEESDQAIEVQASNVVESRRRLMMDKETVKEAEIEDFFQTAEKNIRNKMLECSTKYNFDFEKDEPLGGRYEWVKLNP